MEVFYSGLIDVELDDDIIDDNYIEIENNDIIRLLLDYPNFINSTFIKTRLKNMITIK